MLTIVYMDVPGEICLMIIETISKGKTSVSISNQIVYKNVVLGHHLNNTQTNRFDSSACILFDS